jgi:hypothetical protein
MIHLYDCTYGWRSVSPQVAHHVRIGTVYDIDCVMYNNLSGTCAVVVYDGELLLSCAAEDCRQIGGVDLLPAEIDARPRCGLHGDDLIR